MRGTVLAVMSMLCGCTGLVFEPASQPGQPAEPEPELDGRALYAAHCASCHQALELSTLKGRTVTADGIEAAIDGKISAMGVLRGVLGRAQLEAIAKLFDGLGTTDAFACAGGADEKNSSAELIRLTGPELRSSYRAALPKEVWEAVAPYEYLLPTDELEGSIDRFPGRYTADTAEQLSRFNAHVATALTADSSRIAAFFGPCATPARFTQSCFDAFLDTRGARILRSNLGPADHAELWAVVAQATGVPNQLQTAAQLLLNAPRFAYHLELGEAVDADGYLQLSGYEIASRISYAMTAAPPDDELWAAAVSGTLDLAAVSAHVDRLASTETFRARVVDFVKFYLGRAAANPPPPVADFMAGLDGAGLQAAATDDFDAFIAWVVLEDRGTLSDLFTSKATFPKTAALASIMETATWSAGPPLSSARHPGLLTRPFFTLVSEPNAKLVQRGRAVRINMLCTDVPQPSAGDLAGRPTLSAVDLATLTRRDYIDKATLGAPSCVVCHSKMNQLGFATESYDSVGRYIERERIYDPGNVRVAEQPVTRTSTPAITENDLRVFEGAGDFQAALANAEVLQTCLSRKAYQFFNRQRDSALDACRLNRMHARLRSNQPLFDFLLQDLKHPSVLYKRGAQ